MSRILLTGGEGFLGGYVYNKLIKKGYDVQVPSHKLWDFTNWDDCKNGTYGNDIVIHLAADVGGIGYNQDNPATLFYNNAIMGIQLMEAARLNDVKKFVCVGTICAYPKYTEVPFKETSLWGGYPEETNAPYGLAKKMLLVQSQSYRKQYGFNSIYLLPVNLYGPRDNFNPESSHVILALIKKFVEAIEDNISTVTVWGTGTPSREFLYVEDAAEAIVLATEKYNKPEPVNIGAGFEITIKELVYKISKLTGFKGVVVWDKSKPDGQPRRCLDITRAENEFGFKAKIQFDDGLKKTIDWYMNEQRN
jgi:GDP-L-fucose synthase